ncbi:MAG: hypothetical protein E6G06_16320, partial [Actinobacteria bacterium]
MHGDATHIDTAQFDLPDVHPRRHLQAEAAQAFPDGGGTPHCSCRPGERRQHAVARPFDAAPAEPLQLSLHYVIVLVEQLTPSAVAQVADMLAGAHDVGEQDGGQYSFRFRHVAHTRQELLDLICHAVGSPTPAAGPWDLDV